jgi:hypothetical protein
MVIGDIGGPGSNSSTTRRVRSPSILSRSPRVWPHGSRCIRQPLAPTPRRISRGRPAVAETSVEVAHPSALRARQSPVCPASRAQVSENFTLPGPFPERAMRSRAAAGMSDSGRPIRRITNECLPKRAGSGPAQRLGRSAQGSCCFKITIFIQCVGSLRQIGRQRDPALPPGIRARLGGPEHGPRHRQLRVERSGQVPGPSGPSGGECSETRPCLGRAREKCKAGFTLRSSAEGAGTLTTCFCVFSRNRTEIC